jgi:hypothetical protein
MQRSHLLRAAAVLLVLSPFAALPAVAQWLSGSATITSGGCPFSAPVTTASTYDLNVKSLFAGGNAVGYAAIAQAISCAGKGLGGGTGHNVTVILDLPPETIDLSKTTAVGKGSIAIIGMNCAAPSAPNCGNTGGKPANTSNHLVVRGAGEGKTIIVFALDATNHKNDRVGLWVSDSVNVVFTGMTFTWPYMTVTQGRVVSSTATSAIVDIEKGFPPPSQLIDTVNFPSSGQYLHEFTYYKLAANDPTTYCRFKVDPIVGGYVQSTQIPWVPTGLKQPDPAHYPNRWVIPFESPEKHPPAPGTVLGVKSKEGQNVYTLRNLSNFTFDTVAWVRRSRGVFTGSTFAGHDYGSINVTVVNSTIAREAPINGIQPCMSTPDGGVQIGGRLGLAGSGHYLAGNVFTGAGDDAIALFDVTNSTVVNNTLSSSFSNRGLMMDFTDPKQSVTSGHSGINFCKPPNTLTDDGIFQMVGGPAPSQLLQCP